MVAVEEQHDLGQQRQERQQRKPSWPVRAWRHARTKPLELAANILESITVVLVVFVQDIAFKESVVTSAGLLTASFVLHGLAYRAGQCRVWPKILEMAAPLLFYGLTPAAFLATEATYRSAFITINFWFVAAEVGFMVFARRNFIEEYLQEWNPTEVWGTPLLQHCGRVVAVSWMICQVIMGLAQVVVVAANISIETNLLAGVMMCYVMQLLPLVWAVVFTFVYPARIKRRWGYKPGVRASCYPPPPELTGTAAAAASEASGALEAAAAGRTTEAASPDVDVVGMSRSAAKGCGWGDWGGKLIKRSGSSMRWLLAGSFVSSRSDSSSGSIQPPEDVQVVVDAGN